MTEIQRLRNLIQERQAALAKDSAWAEYSDAQVEVAYANLDVTQKEILATPFASTAELLAGLALLVDLEDEPHFADDFKNQLFAALRKAISGVVRKSHESTF